MKNRVPQSFVRTRLILVSSSLLWVYSTRGWHKNTRHTRHDQVMSAKGTRVCFDTGDYHSIAVLDSGWPFAGILPLPRKLIGILLNLRQRVNPRNSDHPKSRITPLVIVEIMDTKARGILEWPLLWFSTIKICLWGKSNWPR